MGVVITEPDKSLTTGGGIEITDNKIIQLLLRNLNNLIKINGNNEAYVDLQLDKNIQSDDVLPVGVLVGRALQANGWITTGTLLIGKTASGDEIRLLYGDNGKLYTDNGTGAFKQIYLKDEVDALFAQLGTAAYKDIGTNAGDVPVIGANGKLDPSIVPATGATNSFIVANKSELTTLTNAVKGDIAVVTSENMTYILSYDPYSDINNWTGLLTPTGAVSSVNGKQGAVVLTTNDITESNDKLYVSSSEKEDWNGKADADSLSAVATSGSYNDLIDKPTIPAPQIQSDWAQSDTQALDYIKNKPTIPSSVVVDNALNTTSENPVQNKVIANEVNTINSNITSIQGDITTLQTTTSGLISDVAFGSSWDGDTTHAPSKNAVYDVLGGVETLLANL